MKSQLRLKSTFVLFMLILLAGLAVMLWFRYDSETKQYSELQRTLMQQQASQTAKDINNRIDFIRNQMSSISLDSSWLSDLDKFEQDVDVQRKMENRLKLYFPSMYAYSIVSDSGKQLGGDIESFIGKTCLADIKRVTTMFDPKIDFFNYKPYLHRKNGVAHFDVMIPILIHDKKMVFFISFKANILHYVLKEHVISEHSSFIVRKDIPLLICKSFNLI